MKALPHLCFICANLWLKLPVGGFDFDFVRVREELRTQTERFALQREVDEVHGLPGLLLGGTVGELAGIDLEVETAEGDGFYGGVAG